MPDPNDIGTILRAREAADPGYIARLFHIESGGNPNAVTGSNRGLGQFGPQEEARYGITDANRGSREAQAAAVMREAQEHAAVLRRALGRDPTPGEQYLTHQQGIAGGPALLSADPNTPAWQAIRPYYKNDAIARQAITGNVPSNHPLYGQSADQISAGDFRNLWVNKFEGGLAGAPAGAPAPAPAPGILNATGGAPAPDAESAGKPGILNNDPTQNPNIQALLTKAQQMVAGPQQQPSPSSPISIPIPKGLPRANLLAALRGNPTM